MDPPRVLRVRLDLAHARMLARVFFLETGQEENASAASGESEADRPLGLNEGEAGQLVDIRRAEQAQPRELAASEFVAKRTA